MLPDDSAPVVLLRESYGERRWLAIAVGAPEATAMMEAAQRVENVRPSTIELIGQVLHTLGSAVTGVEVTGLHEGTFVADLVLEGGTRVSARPSDAIAIAVRADAPVEVEEAVLDEAAVEIDVVDTSDPAAAMETREREAEIADFRAALEEADPEDFGDQR
ncbi:bifunctional nuclease family protein [Qaidamihabitans albus]|uniref:bifunctional nuclease family protein n=1 Tax=Qaidamihabitans albus TaxID=2795733 RepID=UPI001B357759|nr:bifunctional nuclease family protein [Qaidamihabitans albus]